MAVHRGASKAGKKPLNIHITQEDYELLKELAESECRSATGQVSWLIKAAIKQFKKGKQIED